MEEKDMSLEVDIEKQAGDFHLQVSFSCKEELLGILGASGCGKSMTLKCIAGIEKPDRGRITLDGCILFDSEKKINLPPQKRQVGYLFQNYALFPNMTVRENILSGLHREKDRRKKEETADRMLDLMRLRECAGLRPAQLSGGQAQRTALGRILVNRPLLLMLDEPFSALDTHLRLKLQMELKNLFQEYGRAVLMVTHDRNEAFRMCDKLGVMTEGKMQTVRNTRDLFTDPRTYQTAVLTGCKNIASARKTGSHEVYVPEWNVYLKTDRPVEDDLKAIGLRAHSFSTTKTDNVFSVRIEREMEEPFEWVSEFRCEGQDPKSQALWWRYAKERRPEQLPRQLWVSPGDVLMLYDRM